MTELYTYLDIIQVLGSRPHDVLAAIGPRPTIVVSGTENRYLREADQVLAKVAGDYITGLRVERGHALDQERFDAIVEWIVGPVSDEAERGA